MLFPTDLATADLAVLEAAAPAVHREEYRKTVAAGNRASVTRTDSLGREAATTYTSHTGAVTRHERQPAHGTAMMSLGEERWYRITVQEAVMSCPLSAKIHLLQ